MNPSRLGQEGPRMGKVLNLHPAGFEVLEVQRAELRKRDTGMADVCLTSSWVGQAGGQNAKGKFWWWEGEKRNQHGLLWLECGTSPIDVSKHLVELFEKVLEPRVEPCWKKYVSRGSL